MKPEGSFIAARALAQHCPELLRGRPKAACDPLPAFARLGERLARALAPALAPLYNGAAPSVFCAKPAELALFDLPIEPLAANSLLCSGAVQILASLDAGAVLRMVDRAFGGKGAAPDPLPDAFPLSAELMISRMESAVITALNSALGTGAVTPQRRAGTLAELDYQTSAPTQAMLALEITEADDNRWRLILAVESASLTALLGEGDGPVPAKQHVLAPNPANEPFGDLPLTLSATLVDMPIGVSALSCLRVGQVLPVAVARSVPLSIGNRIIAHGSIGAMDDRVAMQLTHTF